MEHNRKKFTFVTYDGKEVEFISKPFSFETEDIFIECIGKDVFKAYQETGKVEIDLSVEKIKEHFPRLLVRVGHGAEGIGPDQFDDINWRACDKAELAAVYFFFITFNQNVFTDLQVQLDATRLLELQNLMKISNLTPEDISEILKTNGTKSL